MKKFQILFVIALITLVSCGGSSSDDDNGGSNATALEYATFGETLSNVIPDGLKTGGAAVSSISALMKELTGECATDYTECPYITEENGGDSAAGEILMRLWAMDYNDECTDDLITAGTCFACTDCQESGVNYIQPTMLADPTACGTTSTTEAHYVNFGVDPCFFDATIAQIDNIADCETVAGGAVDISSAVPWYASWGLAQTINFSSYTDKEDGAVWWTVNAGESGADHYFFYLSPDWLHVGFKNTTDDTFMFFASGSAAYYEGLGEYSGEGSGVNISAYAGPLSDITQTFEAIQVRDQDYTYIQRIRANETHVWYQAWDEAHVPLTPDDVADAKDAPNDNRCVEIGESVVTSKYVPFADCVTAFEATDVDDLNWDDNYTLKMIDIETAGQIQFSTPLTDTTSTSCLEEEAAQ